MTIITLTTGTAFIMWVGEQITERGIGNGISLIIFAGIVTDIPARRRHVLRRRHKGNIQPLNIAAVVAIMLGTVATIVFFERGSGASRSTTRDARSAGACTAARPRTCRSR